MNTRLSLRSVVTCFAAASLVSCGTAPKDFESQRGPISADQLRPFEILGVVNRATVSLNQPNASNGFSEKITSNVPVGTEVIIPAIRGWTLTFGNGEPNTVESHASVAGAPPLQGPRVDHHWSRGSVNVFVEDINSPAPDGSQTARIEVRLFLSDENSDDKWFGSVNYTLICLGPKSTPRPPPIG